MQRAMKRRGFTLVELLIVIVVIGILSAMMMLSSTEAVTSAKASNIVSNLRNMKTAALALFVDKLDDWENTSQTTGPDFDDVIKYLNSSNANTTAASGTTSGSYDGYGIATTAKTTSYANTKWYVYYTVSDKRVSEKLAGRAQSVGLLAGTVESNVATISQEGSGDSAKDKKYAAITGTSDSTSNVVFMQVR
mgnify:CR=1 FL=1